MNLTGIKDIDFKILNDLDDKSLVKYCSTNKEANKVCNNQIFWMNRVLKTFPYVDVEILRKNKGNRQWSEYYIDDLRKINTSNVDKYLKKGSEEGRMDIVMISINKGADIHAADDYAVQWASESGHIEVVKYLVSVGADIHAADDYAVQLGSKNGHLEVVKYLVSVGADIRTDDDWAVRWASRSGHLEVVKYLVSLGANIRAEDDFAVRVASSNGHLEVVKYLVSLGAPDPII